MNEKGSILRKIFEDKRRRVEAAIEGLGREGVSGIEKRAREAAASLDRFRFSNALRSEDAPNIIAEFKRASPSRGVIDAQADPAARAKEYEAAGAAAISVLTEEDHFRGSPEDLRRISGSVRVPVLRKDFIFDPFQIFEARMIGADAILLIVAMLDDGQLSRLMELAGSLGMDSLVEVHDEEEFERAASLGAKLIGVNNRDLKTFRVSLDVSREMIGRRPSGSLMVSESGISSREEIEELRDLGFNGFLIGEAAMKNGLAGLAGDEAGLPKRAGASDA